MLKVYFSKCICCKCIFAKCTRLTHLLSFASFCFRGCFLLYKTIFISYGRLLTITTHVVGEEKQHISFFRFPQMLECRSDPQPMKIEEPMSENQPLPPTDLLISTNISTTNIIYLAETLFVSDLSISLDPTFESEKFTYHWKYTLAASLQVYYETPVSSHSDVFLFSMFCTFTFISYFLFSYSTLFHA